MSVVMAYIKDGVIYYGCDTRTNYGNDYEEIKYKEGFKLKRYKDIIVGHVGTPPLDIKCFNLMKKFNGDDLRGYLIKEVYPKLLEEADKCGTLEQSSGKTFFGSCFFISKGDKLYLLDSDGVMRITKFVAIGSGFRYVYPFLYNMDEDNINKTLLEAMRTCASTHGKVGGPFQFIDTKNFRMKTEE